MNIVKVGNFEIGNGDLVLLAGPCVIEDRERTLNIGKGIKEITERLGINYVFKASFDKANRSSYESYRGPGLEEGLKILADIKSKLKVPIVTDIHETIQAEAVGEVVDIIQIPAFLCRQTDLLEAAAKTGKVVNVQGDEPLIEPSLIDDLIRLFNEDQNLQMATVSTELTKEDDINNPNNVKVISDLNGYALYFSRSVIPYPRNAGKSKVYKHIGIYAYRRDFLLKYAKMSPTPLEQSESLEQLRALENGYKIKVLRSDNQFIGVDTEEDLKLVNEIYRSEQE